MERLREEVAQTYFDQMSEASANPDPDQLEQMREAFDALNRMIEQREAGEPLDPSLRVVHGAVRRPLPRRPADPRRAARAAGRADGGRRRRCGTRCRPSSAAQLQGLAESLLEDMDLRWQVDRLAGNLQQAVPDAGWEQRYRFSGRRARWAWARPPTPRQSCATSTSSRPSCARPTRRRPCPRSTSTRWRGTSARTPPVRSTVWPSWPSSSRTRVSSTSARAASSSRRRGSGASATRRSPTCSPS